MRTFDWYSKCSSESDVVISSRVRFARNIQGIPFPEKMNSSDREKLNEIVADAAGEEFEKIYLSNLTQPQIYSLVEKNIISRDFAAMPEGKLLLLSKNENVSIMVGEEDHIRIQCIEPGFNLKEAFGTANRIDDLINEKINYAFDEKLGYLTACPTNLGTAMRASVMLHLPAIEESGSMYRLSSNIAKIGLTFRGCCGEGSEPKGAMYQLSNQVTLGLDEMTAIENLMNIAGQFASQERTLRNEMAKSEVTADRVCRSLGILQNARILSTDEFMKLISNVRLGISVGIINGIGLETIGKLIVEMQPATLLCLTDSNLSAERRDSVRASMVRERLK